MKIYSCIFLVAFLLQITLSAKVEETNEIYVTYSSEHRVMIVSNKIQLADPAHDPGLIAEAKKTRESLPAKDFPEGNLGEATNGCQLSLRFTKATYTNGEPIEAILLLRNVTNQIVKYRYLYEVDRFDGPARFDVVSDSHETIPGPQTRSFIGGSSMISEWPLPNTQHKYVEHLNSGYTLTNGTYTVCAVVRSADFSHAVEIRSAPVTIKIVSPP